MQMEVYANTFGCFPCEQRLEELNQMHEAHRCNEERRNKIDPKKINKSHLSIANNEGFTKFVR